MGGQKKSGGEGEIEAAEREGGGAGGGGERLGAGRN